MRIVIVGLALTLASGAAAQESFETWRLHTPSFPSTGGNGVIIGEYRPVIVGDKCTTDFTATLPDGKVYYNSVGFDAIPMQGGTLCTEERWRGADLRADRLTPPPPSCQDRVGR